MKVPYPDPEAGLPPGRSAADASPAAATFALHLSHLPTHHPLASHRCGVLWQVPYAMQAAGGDRLLPWENDDAEPMTGDSGQPRELFVQVEVPEGVEPGQSLVVDLPDGTEATVDVPEDAVLGAVLSVPYANPDFREQ